MVNVLNIKNVEEFNEYTIYCGRSFKYKGEWLKQSVLHNPFKLNNESKREKIIKEFAEYAKTHIKLSWVKRLFEIHKQYNELNLVCFCAPKSCHCDVIKRMVDEFESNV